MCIAAGSEIGEETHDDVDQVLVLYDQRSPDFTAIWRQCDRLGKRVGGRR